jgi:hypothetical protein
MDWLMKFRTSCKAWRSDRDQRGRCEVAAESLRKQERAATEASLGSHRSITMIPADAAAGKAANNRKRHEPFRRHRFRSGLSDHGYWRFFRPCAGLGVQSRRLVGENIRVALSGIHAARIICTRNKTLNNYLGLSAIRTCLFFLFDLHPRSGFIWHSCCDNQNWS